MEKILIVKRRKRKPPKTEPELSTGAPCAFETDQSAGMFVNEGLTVHRNGEEAIAASDDSDTNRKISFTLTPEQTAFIRSNADFESLLENAPGDIKLDVEQAEGGRFVFHFHVQKLQGMRMLKTDEVCRMLQVSKSFLMTLVREKRIKSYKMGRLRRFSLEDVLEYLAGSEEVV